MYKTTTENQAQYHGIYPHPSSAFTFRSPADPNDKNSKFPGFPQAGPANMPPQVTQKDKSALVAEMLKKRREEREGKVESKQVTTIASSRDQQLENSPETMRKIDEPQYSIKDQKQIEYENIQTEPAVRTEMMPQQDAEAETYEMQEPELGKPEFTTESDIMHLESESNSQQLHERPSLSENSQVRNILNTQPVEREMPKPSIIRQSPRMPGPVKTSVFDRLSADAKRKRDLRRPPPQQKAAGAYDKSNWIQPGKSRMATQEIQKSRSPKIEDRVVDYQKEHNAWLRKEQFAKQTLEMNEVKASPKISPRSEKLAKMSPRKYNFQAPKITVPQNYNASRALFTNSSKKSSKQSSAHKTPGPQISLADQKTQQLLEAASKMSQMLTTTEEYNRPSSSQKQYENPKEEKHAYAMEYQRSPVENLVVQKVEPYYEENEQIQEVNPEELNNINEAYERQKEKLHMYLSNEPELLQPQNINSGQLTSREKKREFEPMMQTADSCKMPSSSAYKKPPVVDRKSLGAVNKARQANMGSYAKQREIANKMRESSSKKSNLDSSGKKKMNELSGNLSGSLKKHMARDNFEEIPTYQPQMEQQENICENPKHQAQYSYAPQSYTVPSSTQSNQKRGSQPFPSTKPQYSSSQPQYQAKPQIKSKAQNVEEMLEQRRKQKLNQNMQSREEPKKIFYETIEQRIRRQNSALSCGGTPKTNSKNINSANNSAKTIRSDIEARKNSADSRQNKDRKNDIQSRIIDLMLESGPSAGTPSRARLAQSHTVYKTSSSNANSANKPQTYGPKMHTQSNLPPRLPQQNSYQRPGNWTPRVNEAGLKFQLNVAIRNQQWLQKRNEKITQQLDYKEATKLDGCTFKPRFESKEHKYYMTSGLNECQSVYRGLSPTKISPEEMSIIMHSNSYTQIGEIKARSKSREKSIISNGGKEMSMAMDSRVLVPGYSNHKQTN